MLDRFRICRVNVGRRLTDVGPMRTSAQSVSCQATMWAIALPNRSPIARCGRKRANFDLTQKSPLGGIIKGKSLRKERCSANAIWCSDLQRLVDGQPRAGGGCTTVVSDDSPITDKSTDQTAATPWPRPSAELMVKHTGLEGWRNERPTSPAGVNRYPGRSQCR